jgi:hypothetical protein
MTVFLARRPSPFSGYNNWYDAGLPSRKAPLIASLCDLGLPAFARAQAANAGLRFAAGLILGFAAGGL